ncbi:hypothetical protein BB8028_0004g05990 [Beauveria bassiana]|uniref:Uncharacterized protein n=1 Tax=Beauveria bassiana TaxID=176275 RepID=A0A2S7YBV0_BEABA|nr:hypothetical protein BB8028_0004g05990 [Beauveria bassiana]
MASITLITERTLPTVTNAFGPEARTPRLMRRLQPPSSRVWRLAAPSPLLRCPRLAKPVWIRQVS